MPAGGKRVLGSSMIVSGFSTPHWYIYTVCEYIAKLNRHVCPHAHVRRVHVTVHMTVTVTMNVERM